MKQKKGKFVISNRTCIDGHRLPQGAIYGKDSKGIWYCRDYRIVNMYQVALTALKYNNRAELTRLALQLSIPVLKSESNYQIMIKIRNTVQTKPHKRMCRTESGWEEMIVTPAKLKVDALRICRPITMDNRIKWVTHIECGKHVDHILQMVEKNPEKAIVLRQSLPNEYKQTFIMRDGKIRKKNIPVISNRDAKSVSQDPDGRKVKEYRKDTVMRGPTKHQPKEYTISTGKFYSPAKGHSEEYKAMLKKISQK